MLSEDPKLWGEAVKACVVCQSELKDDARFCPECGAEQPKAEVAPGEDPLLGMIVAKKFKVEKILGVGGMGKVYKARQLALDKAVVVKVLHDQFRDDPQLVQRFQREARAASRLNHPNSIQIIDFGQDDSGVVFMAMEFLQGQDLFALLKKEGPLSPDRVARVMIQVCSALAEAHEQNVIHRDLKPENIMIEDRRGQRDFVKVLDFGIAKIQDPAEQGGQALTQAGMVCGTPEYMSPEQARGLQLDARSDIYALGVIMYQLSTGELPFTADSPIGIVTKHILEAPVPPRVKRPQIPELLEQIILKAMEKDVSGRFNTVVDMGEALELLLRQLPDQGSGFSARPVTSAGVVPPVAPFVSSTPTVTAPTGPGTAVGLTAHDPGHVATSSGGGGNGMKIAAIGVITALVIGIGGVVIFRDKLFGGPAVTVDAGPTVVAAVVDAGTAPTPPPIPVVVDAGTVAGAAVVDAGVVAAPDPVKPDPIKPDVVKPDVVKPDVAKPDVVKPDAPSKTDVAAAKAEVSKIAKKANDEYLGGGCTDGTMKVLLGLAQKYTSYPDTMRYIAQCQFKNNNLPGACAAVNEYIKRGAPPAKSGPLHKMYCK